MSDKRMPLIFIGHGSPMNAIEKNEFTESWSDLWHSLPIPRAILILSAHWITEGETRISTMWNPDMIYDMYGFPRELYGLKYSAPGSPEISKEILEKIRGHEKSGQYPYLEDPKRGYDHGTWSTLMHLFPSATIPIISMSLDYRQSLRWHYNLGKKLQSLREEWILIVWSGNIVHNLGAIDWSGKMKYQWAEEFDHRIAKDVTEWNHEDIIESLSWENARFAHPSHDHLLPLLPLLGASDDNDMIEFLTSEIVLGSLSMRSIVWR